MKAYIPAYNVIAPKTLKDALKQLDKENMVPLAGGTDLMVLLEAGKLPENKTYVSLHALKELHGIKVEKEEIRIGALTTFGELRDNEILKKEFPLFIEAARLLGSIAIQNRATLGGNIANASPAADSPPALLVYDAKLELVSLEGTRLLPLKDFFIDYKKLSLEAGEIIKTIILPRTSKGLKGHYQKVGTRDAQSISKVCFCGAVKMKGDVIEDIRLAWGAVAPIPLRSTLTENFLRGKVLEEDVVNDALNLLNKEISPIDDIRSNKTYRRKVASKVLRHYLENL